MTVVWVFQARCEACGWFRAFHAEPPMIREVDTHRELEHCLHCPWCCRHIEGVKIGTTTITEWPEGDPYGPHEAPPMGRDT